MVRDPVIVPREIHDRAGLLMLYIDVFHVNGIPFLASVDDKVRYRHCVKMKDKTPREFYRAIVLARH